MRRPKEVHRVVEGEDEEHPDPEALHFEGTHSLRVPPSGARRSSQARIVGSRRWPAMALVGAVIGTVAALAAHNLGGSGAGVEGRGGVAQPATVAPAAAEAATRDAAPRPRPRPRQRHVESHAHTVGLSTAALRKKTSLRKKASVVKPVVAAAVWRAAAYALVATENHAPTPVTAEAPAGAQYELGFER
jgi:hypothetical protein